MLGCGWCSVGPLGCPDKALKLLLLRFPQVASGFHTLNPLFATNRFLFQHVGVRSVLRVMLYDRRSGLDSRLLGVAHIPASAIPAGNGGPVYMWVPLLPPDHKKTSRLARIKVRRV
jgi:hypothetical protein